ncbi:hypothetical protein LguiA_007799 [Lonicera macranthoides]
MALLLLLKAVDKDVRLLRISFSKPNSLFDLDSAATEKNIAADFLSTGEARKPISPSRLETPIKDFSRGSKINYINNTCSAFNDHALGNPPCFPPPSTNSYKTALLASSPSSFSLLPTTSSPSLSSELRSITKRMRKRIKKPGSDLHNKNWCKKYNASSLEGRAHLQQRSSNHA